MASPKLPRLDFTQEVEEFDAFAEIKDITFPQCPHKQTKLFSGKLRCSCGASWYGNNGQLLELQRLLQA